MTNVYQEVSIATISEAGGIDANALRALCRAASIAAFIVFLGMAIHLLNASYLEPTFLGFVDKAKDYGDMSKIQNAVEACSLDALQLCSFKYSGFAHMINGLLIMLLGLAVFNVFRFSNPITAQLAFMAAFLSGIGFFATGVTDIPGTAYAGLLRELNPDYNTNILLMTTMIRGIVNMIAITGLGLFAAFTGRAALTSGLFSKWGAWWGFILLFPGLGGLINPIAGFGYIALVLPWLIWLGIQFDSLERA
jgi:hypothetical protein